MRITPLDVAGAALVELTPLTDDRGFFARAWDAEILAAHGLDPALAQMNVSGNRHAGTVRGLHLQAGEDAEAKLFRCVAGRTFHVCVDMRPESATYRSWVGRELSADRFDAFFIPAGCAAGYQALEDGATVLYTASRRYAPGSEQGLRWDDPALGIEWPLADLARSADLVSPKDRAWPLLETAGRGELS